jgi:K+-sensing histidine kinase KdpD
VFDFFLTQPYERFTITRRTDIEMTVLLLVIGVAVAEIAVWGRRQRVTASRRAGYLDGINSTARRGDRQLRVGTDRSGHQLAHAVAVAAIMQLPVRCRRDRPARSAAP